MDTAYHVLRESPKLKDSAKFNKVFISSDRTVDERIKHKELVSQLKKNIQMNSSTHWKISKGKVISSDENEVQDLNDDISEVGTKENQKTERVTRQKTRKLKGEFSRTGS